MVIFLAINSVIFTKQFERTIKSLKDAMIKKKIRNQIKKITDNPETGKPLKYSLKGERTVYAKPFRIIYSFTGNTIIFLRFRHRKDVYR